MEFNLDGKSQFCLLPAKSFNRFGSHLAFSQCVSRKTETLVEEIQNALTKLSASSDSASSSCNDVTDVDDNTESATTTTSTEKVQNKSSSKSRKRKYLSSASTSTSTTSPSTDDMQEACEKCLVSSKSLLRWNLSSQASL